jgi:POT family proton-dependent oligopeptide transporter
MLKLLRAQPRAFQMIFMIELWERFGFYTVQGILILFFVKVLGFSEAESFYTFGAFFALVYGLVAVGGYLGDHVLGTKRTMVLGLVLLALGYLALALTDKQHVFLALGLICVGNGVFKANPCNLLSKCYLAYDTRLHSGFTLYYMSINIGSIASLIIGPALSSRYGYAYAYFVSFVGLMLGLATYGLQRNVVKDINTPADSSDVSVKVWGLILSGVVLATFLCAYLLQHLFIARTTLWMIIIIALTLYFYTMYHETPPVRKRMTVVLILMLEAIIFFVLYQQMPTSLNLYAVHQIRSTLLGVQIDPQSFQALNPIWIIVMSPVLAIVYNKLHEKRISFSIPYKFAFGMLLSGLSFGLLFFSRYLHDSQGMVSAAWLIASYFFQSTGELFVSGLGMAMVAELVPQRMTGFVMGMWFLSSSVAGFIGASVASLTALPNNLQPGLPSLMIYTEAFLYIGVMTLILGVVLWLLAKPLSGLIEERSL